MKKTLSVVAIALFNILFFFSPSASAQVNPTTHYWTAGLSSSTPFFFATYNPGGSNVFVANGTYTYCVDRHWQLGGGVGIGGGASAKQLYCDAAGDSLFSSVRNPYVVPIFLRAKYLFTPHHASGWYANLDAGYMLGFVRSADNTPFNYYGIFASPSLGHQFGNATRRTRVSVGAGLDLFYEGREAELPPYDRKGLVHLNFLAYVTIDFGAAKRVTKGN